MKKVLLWVAVATLAGVIVGGCAKHTATLPTAATTATNKTAALKVYIPCGMIIPMKAAIAKFEQAHPLIKVTGVYDNAGIIVERLVKRHEKGDVVVSPGSTELGNMQKAGLIAAGSQKVIGDFELVVVVPRGNPLHITSPADLKKAKTIACPNTKLNSVGTSGEAALTKLGLWAALKPKMVFTKMAITSYTMVTSGKADACIAYRNCPLETNPKKVAESKVAVAFSFPPDSYKREQCLVAILNSASNRSGAQSFVDYLSSPAGLKVLGDNGMTGCLKLSACPAEAANKKAAASAAKQSS